MQEQVPTVTAVCEARRHQRCAGQVISLVAPAGQRCACPCHAPQVAERLGEVA